VNCNASDSALSGCSADTSLIRYPISDFSFEIILGQCIELGFQQRSGAGETL
jgi:hypothetical protein